MTSNVTPKIIALTGPARIGKTTTAQAIQASLNDRAVVLSFADPLYDMLAACGVPRHAMKHVIHDAIGITPREYLQKTGDHIRKIMGPRWFIDHAMRRARELLTHMPESVELVIIDDLRYDAEAIEVAEHGGIVVRLSGRDDHVPMLSEVQHSSEHGVDARYVHASVGVGALTPEDIARVILSVCTARPSGYLTMS